MLRFARTCAMRDGWPVDNAATAAAAEVKGLPLCWAVPVRSGAGDGQYLHCMALPFCPLALLFSHTSMVVPHTDILYIEKSPWHSKEYYCCEPRHSGGEECRVVFLMGAFPRTRDTSLPPPPHRQTHALPFFWRENGNDMGARFS